MRILKHPILPLWCREDGAICMPPCCRYPKFRWTFGSKNKKGYLRIRFQGEEYRVHKLICETFHGLAPKDGLTADHINRNKLDNRPENLRWLDKYGQNNNRQVCEDSKATYGVRLVEDPTAYKRAYNAAYRATHHKEILAQKAVYYAKQKALGKRQLKCPDGKRRLLTDSEFSAMFG